MGNLTLVNSEHSKAVLDVHISNKSLVANKTKEM